MVPALGGLGVLLLAGAQSSELVTPRGGPVSLPAGAVAELLEGVDLAAPRRAPALSWPEWSDRSPSGWGGELAWRRWVELVRAEAAAEAPVPARRAELAALARLQGRDGDAWLHLLGCASDPALVAALFPLFSPGVPLAQLAAGEPWPEGVLLRPALPPADGSMLRDLAGRALEHRSVRIGAATLLLRTEVDGTGVAVSLTHVAGPAVRVRVAPPASAALPAGIDPGQLFADWEKLENGDEPVELSLTSELVEHSLWLTFRPRETRWPTPRAHMLAGLQPERELVLVSARGDEPVLARFAEALSELFGIRARLTVDDRLAVSPAGAGSLEPLVLRLDTGAVGERKLASLIGLAESFALQGKPSSLAGKRGNDGR